MCGIAGAFYAPAEKTQSWLEDSVKKLIHRGPDASGIVASPWYAVGHTRLAITNPGFTNDQPLKAPNSPWVVVFNGEIYNHRALRRELQISPRLGSDGLVIPYLLARYGPAGLQRLRGMYAIVAIHEQRHEVLFATDPFGVKPLYICEEGPGIAVASEVHPLRSWQSEVRISTFDVAQFLASGSLPLDGSGIEGIKRLVPGQWYIYSERGKKESGSTAPSTDSAASQTWKDVYAVFQETAALNSQTESPTAILLSGGVDSTALAIEAVKANPGIAALTIDGDGSAQHEVERARRTAQALGMNHLVGSAALQDADIDHFFEAMDRPTIDGLNVFIAARIARTHGLKVLLTGTGGDEVLTGYTSSPQIVGGMLAPRLPLRFLAEVVRLRNSGQSIQEKMRRFEFPDCTRSPHSVSEIVEAHRRIWGWREIESSGLKVRQSNQQTHDLPTLPYEGSLLNKYCREQTLQYLMRQLLPDSDVFGMANSIEVRVPFADYSLAASVASLPKRRASKGNFARASGSSLLKDVQKQPKRGFSLPMDAWMRRGVIKERVALMGTRDRPLSGILDPTFIESAYHKWETGREPWYRMWSLVVLDAWLFRVQS